MKPLTIGISAATHQIGLLDQLLASVRPLLGRAELVFDIMVNDGNEAAYLQKLSAGSVGAPPAAQRVRRGGSLGESRNWVLGQARTPYISFLDGDDFLHPDSFAYLLDVIEGRPAPPDLVLFAGRILDGTHSHPWCLEMLPRAPLGTLDDFRDWFGQGGWRLTTACLKVYSRPWLLLSGARFPEGLLYEDTPFWFQVASSVDATTRIVSLDVEGYIYRRWGAQITENRTNRIFDIFWIIEEMRETLTRRSTPAEFWTGFNSWVLHHLLWSTTRAAALPETSQSLFRCLREREAQLAIAALRASGAYHLDLAQETLLLSTAPPPRR